MQNKRSVEGGEPGRLCRQSKGKKCLHVFVLKKGGEGGCPKYIPLPPRERERERVRERERELACTCSANDTQQWVPHFVGQKNQRKWQMVWQMHICAERGRRETRGSREKKSVWYHAVGQCA